MIELDYYLDNYGECDRGPDCYWGKDARGEWNGCLQTGWRGRRCRHWHPDERLAALLFEQSSK